MTYGTKEGFAAYHEERGREIPGTWDDDVVNAALLSASEWIDGVYGPSFVGHKTGGFLQEREWPRINAQVKASGYWGEYYVFPDNAVPDRVIHATYEAAWRHATTPGSLLVDYTPGKYKSVTIEGALSVDFRQFDQSSEIQVQIGAVDTLLWPLLEQSSGSKNSSYSGGTQRV